MVITLTTHYGDVLQMRVNPDLECECLDESVCTATVLVLESNDPDAANIGHCIPCLLSEHTDVASLEFTREGD